MKTATIIFVALTVFSGLFLESSSAPSVVGDRPDEDGVKSILVVVGELFKGLLGVKPEIKESLEGIFKELEKLIIKIHEAIKNSDVGGIQKILKLIIKVVAKFESKVAQLSEKYGDDAKIKSYLAKVTKLVIDSVTNLVKAVKVFLKELVDEIANGIFVELEKLVAGFIKELDKASEGASEDVKELITNIKKLLFKLLAQIREIINAILEAITTGNLKKLLPLVAACKSNIAELKQLCVHADLSAVLKTATKVIELIDVIFAKLVGTIEILIENLPVTVFGKTLKEIEAIIDSLLGELTAETTELGRLLKKVPEFISKLLISLENGNIVAVQDNEVLLCNATKGIEALVAKLLEKLGDGGNKEILEKVLQVVKKVVKKVLTVLAPFLKELVNGVKDIVLQVKEDLAGIFKNIKEVLAVAKGELKELLINILGLLKKLLDKLLDLIKAVEVLVFNVTAKSLNIVNGLLKEISELSSELAGLLDCKANIIGKELEDSIHASLDIQKKAVTLVEAIVKIVVNV